MSTSSCDRTPVNPEGASNKPYTHRTCYVWQPTAGVWVLTLTHFFKRKAAEDTHYYLKAIPSDWGRVFEVKHLDADGGETYHVCLTSDGPCCDCKGFVAHQHCKHAESLTALDALGKLLPLKPPAAKPAPKPAPKATADDDVRCDDCGLSAADCDCSYLTAPQPAGLAREDEFWNI
jgi:hypothetical protein